MIQKEYIRVWDLLVRICHWSVVILVLIAFLSGDEEYKIHIYSGYAVLGIILLRLVWGFTGSKYARFTSFLYPPAKAFQYIKDLAQGVPKYYVGHNPAAGWMVFLLLIMTFFVCVSGHIAYKHEGQELSALNFTLATNAYADSDEDHGEEKDKDEDKDEFWEDIHEGAAFTLLFLIFLHVSGAILSSTRHQENLIKSMVTGIKEKHP